MGVAYQTPKPTPKDIVEAVGQLCRWIEKKPPILATYCSVLDQARLAWNRAWQTLPPPDIPDLFLTALDGSHTFDVCPFEPLASEARTGWIWRAASGGNPHQCRDDAERDPGYQAFDKCKSGPIKVALNLLSQPAAANPVVPEPLMSGFTKAGQYHAVEADQSGRAAAHLRRRP